MALFLTGSSRTDEWINVENRTPANGDTVWVSGGIGQETGEGYYSYDYYGSRGAWFNPQGNIIQVQFWQPIPKAVKPLPPLE